MQVLLDVVEAQQLLDSLVAELDIVIDFALGLLRLLNRLLDHCNSRLTLWWLRVSTDAAL